MNIGVIARRYARALYTFAGEQQQSKTVYKHMKRLGKNFYRLPELRKAIENPVLDVEKKVELLKTAAQCNDDSEKVLEQFFRLVLAQKREKFLQFMIWSYIGLYRRENNILMGRLTTAVPSPVLEKRMTTIIEGKTSKEVEFHTSVDPNIIGGYVLEMAGYRIDASISSQLKRVKNQFVSKNRRIV